MKMTNEIWKRNQRERGNNEDLKGGTKGSACNWGDKASCTHQILSYSRT